MRGISYQAIVDHVKALMGRPPLATAYVALLIDRTGVGRAVGDMMVAAGLDPYGVTIHGGGAILGDVGSRQFSIPKRELITTAKAWLQTGRLRIAPDLEHAETLQRELLDMRVNIGPTGHDSYSAREGQHDDLVLSVAMAVWFRGWINYYDDVANERRHTTSDVG